MADHGYIREGEFERWAGMIVSRLDSMDGKLDAVPDLKTRVAVLEAREATRSTRVGRVSGYVSAIVGAAVSGVISYFFSSK